MKSTKYLGLLLFICLAINCKKNDDNDGIVTVLNDEKKITSFLFNASSNSALTNDITGTINESAKTITAAVPFGTDVTSLKPTIKISVKASIDASNARDFSNDVVYKVTAEDKSTTNYTVTLVIDANSAKKITSFLFDASLNSALANDIIGEINEPGKTILATVPYGTAVTSLKPTIQISEKANIDDDDAKDFSTEVIYKVTAEDNSSVDYTVSVVDEANDEKAITLFQFLADDNGLANDVTSILDEAAKTIKVYIPNTADITNLSLTIDVSVEATYTPTGFQNFTDNVSYTVTAEDGSTVIYQVTVIPVKISSFRFVKFNDIVGEIVLGEGTIDENNSEIEVIVSENQDVANLPAPEIGVLDAITRTPNGQQNFTNPVNYTLLAPNGVSVTYKVTVRKAFKSITGFRFNKSQNPVLASDVIGTINEQQNTIAVVLPKGTNPNVRNNLTPSISVTTGSNATVSPTGAQNFTNAVVYTVTGLDGSTKTYTVSVIISP